MGQSHSVLFPSAVSVAELSAVLLVEGCPYLTNEKLHFNFIGGKIFLVTAYLFLSFSSDIFSSQKAMPNSFPNIYKNLKVVPLIQNSQEFS